MKAIWRAFSRFMSDIWSDCMLAACLLAPILMALLFRFLIPVLEHVLCIRFDMSAILSPYYLLFDLLLAVTAPMMFSFAGVMVILDETDCGISRYLMVTPLGKAGYLSSRIGLPTLLALLYTAVLLHLFSLTPLSPAMTIIIAASCAGMGIIPSMLIVCLARNKVEGMAVSKLSGLLLLGLPIVFFVSSPMAYCFGILPSFWLARLAVTGNALLAFPTLAASLAWICLLYRGFEKRL